MIDLVGEEATWLKVAYVSALFFGCFLLPREKFRKRRWRHDYVIRVDDDSIKRIDNEVDFELLKLTTKVKLNSIDSFEIIPIDEDNLKLKLLKVKLNSGKEKYFGINNNVNVKKLREMLRHHSTDLTSKIKTDK